jgi:elongin-A
VIKTHSTRIWDIGDTEYSLVKDFIDTLPAEQLAAIEEASPVRFSQGSYF